MGWDRITKGPKNDGHYKIYKVFMLIWLRLLQVNSGSFFGFCVNLAPTYTTEFWLIFWFSAYTSEFWTICWFLCQWCWFISDIYEWELDDFWVKNTHFNPAYTWILDTFVWTMIFFSDSTMGSFLSKSLWKNIMSALSYNNVSLVSRNHGQGLMDDPLR